MSASEPPSSPPPSVITDRAQFRALVVVLALFGVLSLVTTRGLFAPVIVAAWFAGLSEGWTARLARRLGGRRRVAAIGTVVLVLLIVLPLVLLTFPLVQMATDVAAEVARAPRGSRVQQLIRAASSGAGQGGSTVGRVVELARSVAPSAAGLVSRAFSAVSTGVIQVFVLAISAYYFAADGPALMARIRAGSPLAPAHQRRFEAEFLDVARAMLVGELLTAAAQGFVAGAVYAAVGVPHALFFAVLTAFMALVPTLGTALVWVPLCGVLLAAGRTREAAVLAVCGVALVGMVDNALRPAFSRLGANKIHPLLLFLGIFGGLEVFGAWGLILGPLALTLFVAAYQLYTDEFAARRAAAQREPPPAQ